MENRQKKLRLDTSRSVTEAHTKKGKITPNRVSQTIVCLNEERKDNVVLKTCYKTQTSKQITKDNLQSAQ